MDLYRHLLKVHNRIVQFQIASSACDKQPRMNKAPSLHPPRPNVWNRRNEGIKSGFERSRLPQTEFRRVSSVSPWGRFCETWRNSLQVSRDATLKRINRQMFSHAVVIDPLRKFPKKGAFCAGEATTPHVASSGLFKEIKLILEWLFITGRVWRVRLARIAFKMLREQFKK